MNLASDVISFYLENKRDLPWRREPTPYRVYVSEIMLQQTRIEAVIPYFERFMKAFPTLNDLAQADEDTCLKLWEGLGYYSRIRNLHKSARIVAEKGGGKFPDTYEELIRLPGIGEYTAKAILAFAFHKPYVPVDGNLMRLYARLEEDQTPPSTQKGGKNSLFAKTGDYFLKRLDGDPSSYGQGLMELGERVCIPDTAPHCEMCPLKAYCKAFKDNKTLLYPSPKEKPEKKSEERTVLVFYKGGKYFIRKREEKGLLASLYGFCDLEGKKDQNEIGEILKEKNLKVSSVQKLCSYKHVFTHRIWNVSAYLVSLEGEFTEDGIWADKESMLDKYSFPSAYRKILEKLV